MNQAYPLPTGNIPIPVARPTSFGRPDAVWQADSKPFTDRLPPLPEGFTLDAGPEQSVAIPGTSELPPLPDGFTLDVDPTVSAPAIAKKQDDAGGFIDAAANIGRGAGERAFDLAGGMLRTAAVSGETVGDFVARSAKMAEQRRLELGREYPSWMRKPSETGEKVLNRSEEDIARESDLLKWANHTATGLEATDFGYEPGTTWEDFKSSPLRNFVPFAVEQGLVSAPDMAAALANLPGYVAARTGELGQQRAQNNGTDNATVDDLLKALPAATVSAMLERFGARGMFGLNEVAVQSLKQVPKEALKAGVKEGATEAGQEGVEYLGSNLGTNKGADLGEMGEQMAAGAVAGTGFGAGVRTATAGTESVLGKVVQEESAKAATEVSPQTAVAELPALPEGYTLDAEPAPVEQVRAIPSVEDSGDSAVSTPTGEVADNPTTMERPAPVSIITPEQRAILRASAIPDDDIDLMSQEELAAKADEAKAAGLSVSKQEIDAAASYSAPTIDAASDGQKLIQASPAPTSSESGNVETQAVMPSERVAEPRIDIAALEQELAKVEGSRGRPVAVASSEDIVPAVERVNLQPTGAQAKASNYRKGHAKISGLDVTIETPKGAIRSGVDGKGRAWSNQMPAHYGYIKRTTGADGDQVDVYVGDNPTSRRVYVVDQKDPVTGRFDEHKAVLGVNSMQEARALYGSSFSDGRGAARLGAIAPMTVTEFRNWIKEGDTRRPVRMGRLGIRTNDQGYPINPKGEIKKPESITEFIARKGGMKEQTGELATIGLRERSGGFVPGAGNVVRPNGMNPDAAREAATEAGYLREGSTIAELYDALDMDSRNSRTTFSRYDDDWSMRWREQEGLARDTDRYGSEEPEPDNTENNPDDELVARDNVYHRLKDDSYQGEFGDEFSQRVADHMLSGVPYDVAIELADAETLQAEGLAELVEADIPFFGDETNEAFAGTAPESIKNLDASSGERNRPGSQEEAGERVEAQPVRSADREEGEGAGSGRNNAGSNSESAEVGSQPVDRTKPREFSRASTEKTRLTVAEREEIRGIIERVAGLSDVQWQERITIPANTSGWGATADTDAEGYYDPTSDVVAIALSDGSRKAGYHEAFHRLQHLFLTDQERRLLASQARQLRDIVEGSPGRADQATSMSPREIEAEAFAIWAERMPIDNAASLRIRAPIRQAWENILRVMNRVKNYLGGKGYQTFEDVFAAAKEGNIQRRGKTPNLDSGRDYSLVERAPADEARSYPEAALGRRLAQTLNVLGKKGVQRIKRKSGRDRATKDDGEGVSDYFHRKLVDYLHPLRMMQESVGAKLNDLNDAYQTARLAEGTIRHEIQQIDAKYTVPMVEALVEGGVTLEELHRYLYALHAEERNRVVGLRHPKGSQLYRAAYDPDVEGASGWSTNKARETLREIAKDRPKLKSLQEAAGHVRAMLDQSLKDQKAAGLLSADTYDMLTSQWKHYVPLKSQDGMDEDGNYLPPASSGFDVRGDEFKSALGLFSDAENVIVHAISQAERSVMRQEKNKVGTAILRFVNQFDPAGENIAQVYWTQEPKDSDVMPDITKMPDVYKRALDADGKVTNRKVPNPLRMRDDAVAVKVGGKTYFVRFRDPKVGLALRKLSLQEITDLGKIARKFSNIQSLINTRMNPAFVPVNLIRDVQTGSAFLLDEGFTVKDVAKVSASIPNAWGALWRQARGRPGSGKWDELLKDFISAGGKISFDQFNTVEETLEKIKRDMLDRSGGRSAHVRVWKSFVQFIEDLNDTAENGLRLAAFAAARDKGRTLKNAAFMARDLTVDFQKKGEFGSELSSWYVFANASIQGNYNLAKRLARSRAVKATAASMILGGFMQHVWNSMMAGDDDDGDSVYAKMLRNEPYKLERQLVFFLPGSKEYVSFPLAYGLNVFWHLGVQGGAVSSGDVDALPAVINSSRVAFDAFNPIGSGSLWSMMSPTITDPMVDIALNENFFGAPIYPQENPFDPAPPPNSHQAFKSTHPFFTWTAERLNALTGGDDIQPGVIDVHPDSMEHLWGFFTGGIGRFLSQTAETGQRALQGEFEPQKTPWVRSFYGAIGEDSQRAEFYDQRERVQAAKSRLKEYQEKGDKTALDEYRQENAQEIRAIGAFDAIEKQRRKLNKQRRELEKRDDSERVQAELKRLDELDLQLMNRARKAFFEVEEAK
ncbi:hypothetical protein LJR030_003144 [Rhizobium sp. LjRoot30]|uniref:LPD38 domain-containing protein n=1 Tax=Rhizobium sp. LjRoot30 TaxID=3342320 RepID=UPI003ECDC0C8